MLIYNFMGITTIKVVGMHGGVRLLTSECVLIIGLIYTFLMCICIFSMNKFSQLVRDNCTSVNINSSSCNLLTSNFG